MSKAKTRSIRIISDMDMIIGNDDLDEVYVFTNHRILLTKLEIIDRASHKPGIEYDPQQQVYQILIGSPADTWLRLNGL